MHQKGENNQALTHFGYFLHEHLPKFGKMGKYTTQKEETGPLHNHTIPGNSRGNLKKKLKEERCGKAMESGTAPIAQSKCRQVFQQLSCCLAGPTNLEIDFHARKACCQ